MEGVQPCVTDADTAAVRLIECMSAMNYDRSNSKCQKTEFEFEFINRTSNFRTSFNNPNVNTAFVHFFILVQERKLEMLDYCYYC